jgi:hypothetical protein
MADHTPGPWTFEDDMGSHIIRGAAQENKTSFGSYYFSPYVASTWGGHNEANARLIAAAPELLAALRLTRGQWIHSINAQECLAAIAKAEGSDHG